MRRGQRAVPLRRQSQVLRKVRVHRRQSGLLSELQGLATAAAPNATTSSRAAVAASLDDFSSWLTDSANAATHLLHAAVKDKYALRPIVTALAPAAFVLGRQQAKPGEESD